MERERLPRRRIRVEDPPDRTIIEIEDATAIKEAGERLLEESKSLTTDSRALLERLAPSNP